MQFYDDKKPNRYITYLDANSLYDWEENEYLPYNGSKWLNQKEIDKLLLNLIECKSIERNSSNGCILEVDLAYPDKLHELNNDYHLDPEKLEITPNMLFGR